MTGVFETFPKDHNGRVVWTLAEINTKMLLIIGIYAPSQGDDPQFFKDEVFPILEKVDFDHVARLQGVARTVPVSRQPSSGQGQTR